MICECHAHLMMDGVNYRRAVKEHREGVNEKRLREHLRAYRDCGVTFIRDGGDHLGVSERARELAGEYGICYRTPAFAIHRAGHYGGIVGKEADSLKEYHALVREVRRRKGDFIKIMVSGIMEYREFGLLSESALEKEWIREMIHIAHEEGFSVMVHANGTEAVLPAVEAGADSIEHGNYIDEECLDAMAEEDCVWVPTIVTTRNLIGCGRYPDEVLCRIYETECENLKKACQKGVLLATGSDGGAYLVPHGKGVLQEMEIFRETLADQTVREVEELLEKGARRVREISGSHA